MAVVWVTLLIGLGAMLGMAALVIDVGYGMGQMRAMQNGADAGAMAAAKLLAGSVSSAGGGVAYTVSNGALHAKADEFAGYNRPASMAQFDLSELLALLRPSVAYAQLGTTTITVVCNPDPAAPGSPTTCTATVQDTSRITPPTGTVTFSDTSGTGTFSSATCSLLPHPGGQGRARCSVTYTPTQLGPETIAAAYSGDGTFAPNSNSTSLSVAPPTPTPTPGPTSTPAPTATPTLPPAPTPPPTPPRASYPIAVQYLDCSGNPAPAPNFTAESDLSLVLEINQTLTGSATDTRQASTADVVPAPPSLCAVRVFARVTHSAAFATALGVSTMTETARATARILPADPPTEATGVLPITKWVCNGLDEDVDDPDGCDYPEEDYHCPPATPPQPCVFWDSNSDPKGPFKFYVDMSWHSALARTINPASNRVQHLNNWPAAAPDDPPPPVVDYDTSWPGNSPQRQDDIGVWAAKGWGGWIRADPADTECDDSAQVWITTSSPSWPVLPCENSRLEMYSDTGGNLGQNVGLALNQYITANKEGDDLHPSCYGQGQPNPTNGEFASATVFFWRYAEKDKPGVTPASLAATDEGSTWDPVAGNGANLIKRIVVYRLARFQFCRGHITQGAGGGGGSKVKGFFVAWVTSQPQPCVAPCLPSAIANAVTLSE